MRKSLPFQKNSEMRILLFIAQILLGNTKNDVRWRKEREFSWASEVPDSRSEMVIAIKGQSE